MRRVKKQERLPLNDDALTDTQEEIILDIKRRIDNLTGITEEYVDEETNSIILQTRDMTFATIKAEDDYIKVTCPVPYDRILDMSSKCNVEPYAGDHQTDLVSYNVRTKFDVQYAVSIVQQSFMFRKRLKL